MQTCALLSLDIYQIIIKTCPSGLDTFGVCKLLSSRNAATYCSREFEVHSNHKYISWNCCDLYKSHVRSFCLVWIFSYKTWMKRTWLCKMTNNWESPWNLSNLWPGLKLSDRNLSSTSLFDARHEAGEEKSTGKFMFFFELFCDMDWGSVKVGFGAGQIWFNRKICQCTVKSGTLA